MKYLRKNLKKIIIIIVLILIIILSLLKIYLNNNSKLEIDNSTEDDLVLEEIINVDEILSEATEEIKKNVFVDIKGAVLNPGVYEIEENKKVIDVVNLAGGLADVADTSMINLAKKVTDEMVVIVYTKEEVEKAKAEDPIVKIIEKECVCPEIKNDACLEDKEEETTPDTNNQKINLNEATLEELQTLSGIGESKAQAIIAYREEVGKFTSIEELKQVTGIGETLYESIKDNITV